VFPTNSAERYCSVAGVVDPDLAQKEAVAWEDRAGLALIERAAEALATAPGDWPHVICDRYRFLEAVVAPGLPLAAIEAVRMRHTSLDRLEDLTVQGLDGDLRPGTAQRELTAFETLHRWRAAHGIAIESVR